MKTITTIIIITFSLLSLSLTGCGDMNEMDSAGLLLDMYAMDGAQTLKQAQSAAILSGVAKTAGNRQHDKKVAESGRTNINVSGTKQGYNQDPSVPPGTYKLSNGRFHLMDQYMWIDNNNKNTGARRVPNNSRTFTKENSVYWIPNDGYQWIDPENRWAGVKEITRSITALKNKDFNNNGVIEAHEVFEIKPGSEIYLSGFNLCCRYNTPDTGSPVEWTTFYPDGNPCGEVGMNISSKALYIWSQADPEMNQSGLYKITATQGDITVSTQVKIIVD